MYFSHDQIYQYVIFIESFLIQNSIFYAWIIYRHPKAALVKSSKNCLRILGQTLNTLYSMFSRLLHNIRRWRCLNQWNNLFNQKFNYIHTYIYKHDRADEFDETCKSTTNAAAIAATTIILVSVVFFSRVKRRSKAAPQGTSRSNSSRPTAQCSIRSTTIINQLMEVATAFQRRRWQRRRRQLRQWPTDDRRTNRFATVHTT